MLQNPSALLMVRPRSFGFNSQTAFSNAFQRSGDEAPEIILARAQREFDLMVESLRGHHIEVWVADDTETPAKPDAIFPNNWVSFHEDGRVVLYPMEAVNRRYERRLDIIQWLREKFDIREVLDESSFELQDRFLEGTGSLVFDHPNRIAYACRSSRTDEGLAERICELLGYQLVLFNAVDEGGLPIYHTNVMLCVGSAFAAICLDAIRGENDLDLVLDSFARTGHQVIAISFEQMKAFAGNMIEVNNMTESPYILLSQSAFESLLPGQLDALSKTAEPLPISIPTIERYGGGSVRCMVAGIHLRRK